jgi:GTP-binding protein EngB required for normal cell division
MNKPVSLPNNPESYISSQQQTNLRETSKIMPNDLVLPSEPSNQDNQISPSKNFLNGERSSDLTSLDDSTQLTPSVKNPVNEKGLPSLNESYLNASGGETIQISSTHNHDEPCTIFGSINSVSQTGASRPPHQIEDKGLANHVASPHVHTTLGQPNNPLPPAAKTHANQSASSTIPTNNMVSEENYPSNSLPNDIKQPSIPSTEEAKQDLDLVKIFIEGYTKKLKKLNLKSSLQESRIPIEQLFKQNEPDLDLGEYNFAMDGAEIGLNDEIEIKLEDIITDEGKGKQIELVKRKTEKVNKTTESVPQPARPSNGFHQVSSQPTGVYGKQAETFHNTTIRQSEVAFSLQPKAHSKPAIPKGAMILKAEDKPVPNSELVIYQCPQVLPEKNTNNPHLNDPSYQRQQDAKYVIVLGESGVGKSTLINSIVNYLHGVQITDSFRLQLVKEDTRQNVSMSQTSTVNMYTIESPFLKFPIVLIDTPGYNDTSGIGRDKETDAQLERLLTEDVKAVHLICFVAKANTIRITDTQKYVYKKIVDLFGEDITENLTFLFTFCDNNLPQVSKELVKPDSIVLPMIKKMSDNWFIKFNSSSLYETYDEKNPDVFVKLYWDFGLKGTEALITKLMKSNPKKTDRIKESVLRRQQQQQALNSLYAQIEYEVREIVNWRDSIRSDSVAAARLQYSIAAMGTDTTKLNKTNQANRSGSAVIPTLAESELSNLNKKKVAIEKKMKYTQECLESSFKQIGILLKKVKASKLQLSQIGTAPVSGLPEFPYLEKALQFEMGQKENLHDLRISTIKNMEEQIELFENHVKMSIRDEGFDACWEKFLQVHGPKKVISSDSGEKLTESKVPPKSGSCM